jgi:maleate isomerase
VRRVVPAIETGARVGLLVPSSNTVMEPDFWRALPPGATLHTARMYLEDTTPEGESRMLDEHMLPAARDLATARPDLIVFGCTSAGALRGNDHDAELCRRISDLSGVPTVSVIASVRRAIAASGARRVGVVTPYVEALNRRIAESIQADGVEVSAIAGLGISDNFEIARVPVAEICDFAERALRGAPVDLAFVSCTNFPAVSALPALQRRLGLPAVTSNQAAIAAVLGLLAPARRGG